MREHFFIALSVIQQTGQGQNKKEETLNVSVQISHISAIIPAEYGCDILLSNSLLYKTKNNLEDILKRTGQYGLLKVV